MILKGLRKGYQLLFDTKSRTDNFVKFNSEDTNELISESLNGPKPFAITRIGATELNIITTYLVQSESLFERYKHYVLGNIFSYKWTKKLRTQALEVSGIFPPDNDVFVRLSKLYLKELNEVDILGSWLVQERQLLPHLSKCRMVRLADLEPYYHTNPWSSNLYEKKVLVIHPFVDTIRNQYNNRLDIFDNPLVLPEFELLTYKPIVSHGGESTRFKNWFDALDFMKEDISKLEFDVAIIGCGAYGLPLTTFIKRLGKKAIHLGGATQILFGIMGKRWEDHAKIVNLKNEFWVRPNPIERPVSFNNVEHGAYW